MIYNCFRYNRFQRKWCMCSRSRTSLSLPLVLYLSVSLPSLSLSRAKKNRKPIISYWKKYFYNFFNWIEQNSILSRKRLIAGANEKVKIICKIILFACWNFDATHCVVLSFCKNYTCENFFSPIYENQYVIIISSA